MLQKWKIKKKKRKKRNEFTLKLALPFSFKEYPCLITIPEIAISSVMRVKYESGNGVYFPA